jgi:hypothetical protein
LTVAPRNQAQLLVTASRNGHYFSIHNAMHEKPLFPKEYCNFARQNFFERGALNQNHIAGNNRGHHAHSKNSEAKLAEIANNFSRKSARKFHGSVSLAVSRLIKNSARRF